MTLSRLADFTAYWNKNPPTHIIAKAVAGIKTQPDKKGKPEALPDFAALPDVEE